MQTKYFFLLLLFTELVSLNLISQTHPRLFFYESDHVLLAQKATTTVGAEMIEELQNQLTYQIVNADTTAVGNKSQIAALSAFLYWVTKDEKYAQNALFYVKKVFVDNDEKWAVTNLKGLTSYNMGYQVAIAYDWCYNSASWTTEHNSISQKIKTMADMIATNGGTEQNTNKASNWQGIRAASSLVCYLATDDSYNSSNFNLMNKKLTDFITDNYGDSVMSAGWNIEGLGYTYYPVGGFIGPAGIALERYKKELGLRKFPSFVNTYWSIYTTNSTALNLLDFGSFHPDFGDDNPHVSGEGVFGQSFYYLPPEMQQAAKYWYDKSIGSVRSKYKYDGYRLGTVWSFLYYPVDGIASNPTLMTPVQTLHQDATTGNGYYLFRNKYENATDLMAQMYLKFRGNKGHNGPDALTFRIIGNGAAWAVGGGRYGTKVSTAINQDVYMHLMNTVYPNEPLQAKIGTVGCTTCSTNGNSGQLIGKPLLKPDGSGHVIARMDANNVWALNHKRWFVADYDSLKTHAKALYIVADSSQNGKYWQMITAVENTVTFNQDSFLITTSNGASMRGMVLYADGQTPVFETGTTVRGSAFGTAPDSKFITVLRQNAKFIVALTIIDAGKKHPTIQLTNGSSLLNSTISVNGYSYKLANDNVLYDSQIQVSLPQAIWSVKPLSGFAPLTVQFDARNSQSFSGQPAQVQISPDNIQNFTQQQLSYTYTQPGAYIARLDVSDNVTYNARRYAYILVGGNTLSTHLAQLESNSFTWTISNNLLTVDLNENHRYSKVELFDIAGRIIYQSAIYINNPVVNLTNYKAGIYIVRLSGNERKSTFKLIKQ
jgi:PKD repeat protein